jgi:hypothetical protein
MQYHTPTPLEQLIRLERMICDGLSAYEARNQLIVDLVAAGVSKAEIARQLNAVRDHEGAPRLTPAAITATCKRLAHGVPEIRA